MTKEKIQEAYSETSSALNSIYKKRKVATVSQKVMWLLTGMYFLLMLLFPLSNYYPDKFPALFTFLEQFKSTIERPYAILYPIIPVFLLIYLTTFLFGSFFKKFKLLETETFSKMFKILFPQFHFSQSSQLHINQIKESKLFSWIKADTTIITYGLMTTEVNDVKLHISDFGIIEENMINKVITFLMKVPFLNFIVLIYQFIIKNLFSSKSPENVYYTFRGMYVRANFNKQLNGATVLVPNSIKSRIDRYVSFKFKEEERVILEDVRFAEYFTVYSTDQVEARYVLSSTIMEKIVQLREKFDRNIMLSFLNNKMFLTVENPNGIFSFPSGKLDSIEVIEEIVLDIQTAQGLVEDFNLSKIRFSNMVV